MAPTLPSSLTRPSLLRVTFLDVGQGDAAAISFPDGRNLTLDAGGLAGTSFDIGRQVVTPALWALGFRRLDYLTFTHSDVDHLGGASALFDDLQPTEVWEGIPVPPHVATQALRRLADGAGTPWRTLQPGDRVAFGPAELLIWHPPPPEWERQDVRNDDSVVMEVTLGDVSFLFTGDISREVEQCLAPKLSRPRIRVLKVPHHGSATSSSAEFLRAVDPDVAVISSGRSNPYGHPAPAVVQRYRDIGAAMYRTDQDGAVMMETDGETLRVRTVTNRKLTLRVH
jgi:competence protein ComEC